MNKGRGIWIVIGSILVIGVLMTLATTSFINSKETAPSPVGVQNYSSSELTSNQEYGAYYNKEKPKEQSSYPEEGASLKRSAKVDAKGEASQRMMAAAEPEPEEKTEMIQDSSEADSAPAPSLKVAEAAEQETVLSPISPDIKAKVSVESNTDDGAVTYQKHLKSLDEQIKKIRDESGNSNTYSMKALADKELKLWDTEQNTIYDTIAQSLSEEERKTLEQSQQTWMKSRDAKAEEAAKKFSGGSLEGLEYTASLADSTRTRAYDLVKEYSEVLSTLNNQ